MQISEAVKKAVETGGYITGGFAGAFKDCVFIKPTDGPNCCIICLTKNRMRRGWQPSASDLMSDSWQVVSPEEFLTLSSSCNLF